MDKTCFRWAKRGDTQDILQLIKELAEYEKMLDQVTATPEILEKQLFDDKRAEVILADYDGKLAGFALFFHNFSTFLGKSGMYLEDIYIRPEFRGKKIGINFMKKLAQIAEERDCGRIEWVCLDWNKSSIDFYLKLGAVPLSDWTIYRLDQNAIAEVAKLD